MPITFSRTGVEPTVRFTRAPLNERGKTNQMGGELTTHCDRQTGRVLSTRCERIQSPSFYLVFSQLIRLLKANPFTVDMKPKQKILCCTSLLHYLSPLFLPSVQSTNFLHLGGDLNLMCSHIDRIPSDNLPLAFLLQRKSYNPVWMMFW